MDSKLSSVKYESYESTKVYQKIREETNFLGGINCFVKRGEQVLLKPNFLTGRPPEKNVNTHPSIVGTGPHAAIDLENGSLLKLFKHFK